MVTAAATTTANVRSVLDKVMDPEIPVLSVLNLGVVRDIQLNGSNLEVVITPTYSGCPAMAMIEQQIREALERVGFEDVRVTTVLSPPWTTDWIDDDGRAKLSAYGIAPPAEGSPDKRLLFAEGPEVACPRCGSTDTEMISEFGSTACKALYRCRSCLEPFDYFKCI